MNRYRIAHDRPAWLSVLLCLALVLSSLLPVRTAQATATLVISKTLIGSQTAFESGANFQYRLTWQCAGAISPQDDCYDMKIVDVLPEYIEFVSMDIVPPVTSVTTSGANDNPQTVTVNFSSPVLAGATGSMEMTVRYRPGVTPNALTSSNTATLQANTNLGVPIPPVTSSPPVVTTSIAVDKSTAAKTVTSGGTAGGNTTYRIRVSAGSGTGFLGVTNLTVSDVLPPGATFVSATTPSGGTLVSAPPVGSPGTVSWTWAGSSTE